VRFYVRLAVLIQPCRLKFQTISNARIRTGGIGVKKALIDNVNEIHGDNHVWTIEELITA